MNIEATKVELINWIVQMQDQQSIQKLLKLKGTLDKAVDKDNTQLYGSGKDLIEFVSEDFDEPLEIFKDYEK